MAEIYGKIDISLIVSFLAECTREHIQSYLTESIWMCWRWKTCVDQKSCRRTPFIWYKKKTWKKHFGFLLVEKEQKLNSGNNFGRVNAQIGHGILFVSHQPFDSDVIEPKMNLEKCHQIAASNVTNMHRNQHFLNVTWARERAWLNFIETKSHFTFGALHFSFSFARHNETNRTEHTLKREFCMEIQNWCVYRGKTKNIAAAHKWINETLHFLLKLDVYGLRCIQAECSYFGMNLLLNAHLVCGRSCERPFTFDRSLSLSMCVCECVIKRR